MNALHLNRKELIAENGELVHLVYEEEGDILELFFGGNEPATGVELTDHILLRVNQTTGRAVSLTMLHFSILAERTEYGPRSYPMNNLKELPEDLRELVLRIVTTAPVNQFLKLSYFQASQTKQVPFTYVASDHFASVA
jgi:hypothetical protein